MKKVKVFVLIALIFSSALFVWAYYAPERTLQKIKDAAEKGDAETLSDLVDFPSVRQSIKDEFNSMMARTMTERTDNPFAAIGMMMASAFADRLVDSMVTPSSISAFAKGLKPSGNQESSNYGSKNDNASKAEEYKIYRTTRYDGFSKYIIEFKDKEKKSEGIILVMRRYGFSWKLTAIRFLKTPGE